MTWVLIPSELQSTVAAMAAAASRRETIILDAISEVQLQEFSSTANIQADHTTDCYWVPINI